jgi:hypothetical protein
VRLKVYRISAWSGRLDALVEVGQVVAAATLPPDATKDDRYGVGFLGVHDGQMASYVFVSWWAKLYELNHFLFKRPRGESGDFTPAGPGLFGCVICPDRIRTGCVDRVDDGWQ